MSVRINSVMQQHVANNISRADNVRKIGQKQVASGQRMFEASQEPAAVALSEKFRARIQGLRESANNIGQAQSAIQVASGAAQSVGGALQRMRTLAIEAASGTLSPEQRATMQQELGELQETVESVATGTEFNGVELTNGVVGSFEVQVGEMAGDTMTVGLGDFTGANLGTDAGSISIGTQADAQAAISAIDGAIEQVANQESAFGAVSNRLGVSFDGVQGEVENMVDTESRIRDVDTAETAAMVAREEIMSKAGMAVLVQANTDSRFAARLLS